MNIEASKLSELIFELMKVLDTYGDIEIYNSSDVSIYVEDWSGLPISDVVLVLE